jgi:formamidopyrimidine-DNA glycosylase
MPELPEVETIARKLRKAIIGKSVASVQVSGLSLRKPIEKSFAQGLRGRTVRGIHRRGKYLILELAPRGFCLIHLGMSGRILFHQGGITPLKHTHAVIRFSDGTELQYRDQRRFGQLSLHEVAKLDQVPELRLLGIDPTSAQFTPERLSGCLRESRRDIKSFLLDQRRIAGLGNIYICESLFRAGIHPGRRCCSLTQKETRELNRAIRTVLKSAVRFRGTSFSDFMDSDGNPGENQKYLEVYQREGDLCRRCKSKILRLRQGGRSSFLCPRCQT